MFPNLGLNFLQTEPTSRLEVLTKKLQGTLVVCGLRRPGTRACRVSEHHAVRAEKAASEVRQDSAAVGLQRPKRPTHIDTYMCVCVHVVI